MRGRVHTENTGNHGDALSLPGLHDEATQAVSQARHIEVHQRADPVPSQTQIGEKLGFVNGKNVLDRLYFYNDFVCHDDIGPEAIFKQSPAVHDWQLDLPFERESDVRQFTAKAFLINRPKQSRSKLFMDLDCQSDNSLRQFARTSKIHLSVSPWFPVFSV